MVPILETERLRLRAVAASDLDQWAEVNTRSEVTRYLGGTAFSREESWRRLLTASGSWSVLGFGYWAVELKAGDGRMIGHAGFSDFKRDITPSIEGLPEMGWVFAPEAQGQGLASEAVAAALSWADEALAAPEIAAIIAPDNRPSIRLAGKNGFAETDRAAYKGEPILIFRRRAST